MEKGLTEENVKVRTRGSAPLQTVPAAMCLALSQAMLSGCLGVWGASTPLAAGFVFLKRAPCTPRGFSILRADEPGGCQEDSASGFHSPTPDFLSLLDMTTLSSNLLMPGPLALSQRKIPSQEPLGA